MTNERALVEMFHSALDREDVSGPFQRLRLELEKPGAARLRTGRRIFMTRNRMVLLAAALVLIVISGVFVGTRLVNRTTSQIPAGHAGIDQAEVMQLLSRPVTLPHLAASDSCQDGPYTAGFFGAGPVFGGGNGPNATSWGSYWDVVYYTKPGQKGPVVVRAFDLKLGWPVVFLGPYGVGPAYGTDDYKGSTRTEYIAVAFDTDHVSPTQSQRLNNPPGTFVQWRLSQGIKHGGSGCFGYQIDGPDFTETFYSTEQTPI